MSNRLDDHYDDDNTVDVLCEFEADLAAKWAMLDQASLVDAFHAQHEEDDIYLDEYFFSQALDELRFTQSFSFTQDRNE